MGRISRRHRTWSCKHTLLGGAILLAGCVSFSSQPNPAFRLPDDSTSLGPPSNQPPATSFMAPPRPPITSGAPVQPPPVRQAPPPSTSGPGTWRTTPTPRPPFEAQRPAPPPLTAPGSRPAPRSNPGPHPSFRFDPGFPKLGDSARAAVTPPPVPRPLPQTPRIIPDGVTVRKRLDMTIDVPRRKQIGSDVAYRITIKNSGDEPAEEVSVHCEFDPALTFTGSTDRTVIHRIGELLPGETRELALNLRASKTGTHCCRFSLRSMEEEREEETLWKSVCVDYVEQYLEIDVLGPQQRTVGSRAEFNLSFVNRSDKPILNARVSATYDAALIPREATAGATQTTGHLAWDLGTVQPGEGVQLQVEFECHTPARRACLLLEVGGTDVPVEQAESCVEIIPLPGLLELQVSDRTDPVSVGDKATFEVVVQNAGLQLAREVQLSVEAGDGLKILTGSVQQGDQQLPWKSNLQDNRLVFDPVDQLAPDVRFTFIIEVEALRPGSAELSAHLTSSLSRIPVSSAEPIRVNAK